VFNGVVRYWPTILSRSYKHAPPTILDPDPPGVSNKKVAEKIRVGKNAKISLTEMDED
jgi:hypothetical protein